MCNKCIFTELSQRVHVNVDKYLEFSKHPLHHYAYPSEKANARFDISVHSQNYRVFKQPPTFFQRFFCL